MTDEAQMPRTIEVPLSALHPGADLAINARTTGQEDGIDTLAKSLLHKGQLHPLLVIPGEGGVFTVADGNRRLAAFRALERDGEIQSPPFMVSVTVRYEDLRGALETSLAANIERVPLHQVDQYEAFAALAEQGIGAEVIGYRFGMPLADVRKRLALGNLHPTIREAWRSDQLGHTEVDIVRAFTLTTDQDRQLAVYERLKAANRLWAHEVREALGSTQNAKRLLKALGVEAYEAAGGSVLRDLFGEEDVPLDPTLLEETITAKLDDDATGRMLVDDWGGKLVDLDFRRHVYLGLTPAAEVVYWPDEDARLEALEAENNTGWAAARAEAELIRDEARARAMTPEERARTWVVCGVDAGGRLRTALGIIPPAEAADAPEGAPRVRESADAKPAKVKPRIPAKATASLFDDRTAALRGSYRLSPLRSITLAIAAMMRPGAGLPLHIRGARDLDAVDKAFPELVDLDVPALVQAIDAMDDRQKLGLFACVTVASFDASARAVYDPFSSTHKGVNEAGVQAAYALVEDDISDSLRECFRPYDYVRHLPKAQILADVTEACGATVAKAISKLPKDQLIAHAAKHLEGSPWLPPELRTVGYVYTEVAPAPEAPPAPEPEAGTTITAGSVPTLTKPQREQLLALHAAEAWNKAAAVYGPQYQPGSIGSLINNGLAFKRTMRAGPDRRGGQVTGYWLSAEGINCARRLVEAAAAKPKRG